MGGSVLAIRMITLTKICLGKYLHRIQVIEWNICDLLLVWVYSGQQQWCVKDDSPIFYSKSLPSLERSRSGRLMKTDAWPSG